MTQTRTVAASRILIAPVWLRACYQEHRILLALIAGYLVVGGLLLLLIDRPWPLKVTTRFFVALCAAVTLPWLAWQWIRHPKRLAAAIAPTRVSGALLVLGLAVPIQITFQALKQSIAPVIGFPLDGVWHRADVWLHGGRPAWQWLSPLLERAAIVRAIDSLYVLWFLWLLLVVIWLAWTRERALRQRSLLALLLLWIGGGTIGAWLFASAGPCYSGDPAYTALLDRLDTIGGTLARRNQLGLWELWQRDEWGQFAGISAMPSMHVGLAVLLAIVLWHRARPLGVFLGLYAVVMQIGSVLLAWHYAIDGYVGALIAWGCWHWAGRLTGGKHG